MEVYIEYVIVDNLVINMLILLCVKLTLKLKTNFWKIFLSSVIGTIFACIYPLMGLSQIILVPLKLFLGVVMVLIISKFYYLKDFIFAYLLFITFTLVFGGACIATLLVMGTDISKLSSGYDAAVPVGLVMLIIALYVAIIVYVAWYLNRRKVISSYLKQVKLKIGQKELLLSGFVDTGNNLIDKQSGLPVVIISVKSLEKYFSEDEISQLMLGGGKLQNCPFKKVHSTPYGTVNGKDMKMVVFQADSLCINNQNGEYKTSNFVVGVTYRQFKDAVNFDMLLNPALL